MLIKDILNKAKELLEYDKDVKIRVRMLKTTLATVSLSRRVITVDPRVLYLDKSIILFILVHELAHLKIGTVYHTKEFWNEIEKIFGKSQIQLLEKEAIKALA